MTDLSEKLSAYIDGELGREDASELEALIARDAAVQAELDALIEADTLAQEQFDEGLNAPIPFALVQQIKAAELEPAPAAQSPVPQRPIWGTLAAGLALFMMGGLGGYALKTPAQPEGPPVWLAQIADYHAVYAAQSRHLVEVGAEEADHIEAWLGRTTGAQFAIPDLTPHGLTFEGGRLVVAAGKPVAQLMYRMADGTVVALCLQRSSKDPSVDPAFHERSIENFDFVSWTANGADYVVIGPQGNTDLIEIATTAALEV